MSIFWNPLAATLVGWAIGLCSIPTTASAQTLPELWERLATTEPTLLATMAQAQAITERQNQTWAQFLPQVSASANYTRNQRAYQTTGVLPTLSEERYNSKGVQLNLTQPLWHQANPIAHRQAGAAAEQAVQQMLATQQDLLGKLVTAWAEDLYAQDALNTALALETAANRQLLTYERGLTLGLYGLSERDEAKAKRQQAIAERFAAESEQFARHTALEQLVGPLPALSTDLVRLQTQKIPYATLPPLATFTNALEDNNPAIRAAERALKVAHEEVRKQQAQHSPTLDLVAGIGSTTQPAGTTPNQSGFKNRQDSVGLQLNVPLYAGGATSSKVREALFLETKARYELDAAKRTALTQASQAWAQLRSAQAKLEVAELALTAGLSAERLAMVGQKNGTKTPLDELQAKQQIETARRDGKRAYYDNVIGMAKLLTATGLMEEDTLRDIQQRLQNPSSFAQIPGIAATPLED
jgi:outer membrane protein